MTNDQKFVLKIEMNQTFYPEFLRVIEPDGTEVFMHTHIVYGEAVECESYEAFRARATQYIEQAPYPYVDIPVGGQFKCASGLVVEAVEKPEGGATCRGCVFNGPGLSCSFSRDSSVLLCESVPHGSRIFKEVPRD